MASRGDTEGGDEAANVEYVAGTGLTALAAIIDPTGGALTAIVAGVVGHRAAARVREMADEAFREISPEALVRRASEDERVADLLVRALDASHRTAVAAKRRLMGRVVARACHDPAQIDEYELLAWALGEMEAPHFRLLAEVGALSTVEQIEEVCTRYPSPVAATLIRVGVGDGAPRYIDGGSASDPPTHRDRAVLLSGLSPFGRRLLGWVTEM